MIPALAFTILLSLHLAGLLRACLPGELLHRYALPRYQWLQLHWPRLLPQKWNTCVYCATFFLLGLPVAALASLWLGWWALAIPLPLAVLTDLLTRPYLKS